MTQLTALALSIALEAGIAFAVIRAAGWGSGINAALAASLGTLITHPFAWFAVPRLAGPIGYPAAVALVETGVVLAESVAYRLIVPLAWPRALAASLIANAASTTVGLAYYALAA